MTVWGRVAAVNGGVAEVLTNIRVATQHSQAGNLIELFLDGIYS